MDSEWTHHLEDVEGIWMDSYHGDEWATGIIIVSAKDKTTLVSLYAAVDGEDGRNYLVPPLLGLPCPGTHPRPRKHRILHRRRGYTLESTSKSEFLEATGWTEADVRAWAEWTMWGFFVPGYLECNAGVTRFSGGDVGRMRVETPWSSYEVSPGSVPQAPELPGRVAEATERDASGAG